MQFFRNLTITQVLFFRSEESVLLSFLQATDEASVAIYLSDWLASDTVDTGQLERIHIGSCSLLSSVDLFDSLEFEAIRDYYKYPLSRYIAAYDVVFPSVNFRRLARAIPATGIIIREAFDCEARRCEGLSRQALTGGPRWWPPRRPRGCWRARRSPRGRSRPRRRRGGRARSGGLRRARSGMSRL